MTVLSTKGFKRFHRGSIGDTYRVSGGLGFVLESFRSDREMVKGSQIVSGAF